MKYFTKSDDNTNIPVRLASVSPTGKYFVGRDSGYVDTINLYRTLHQTEGEVYGETIMSTKSFYEDSATFKGVEWFEEYGFVKIIFHIWEIFDNETTRLYFDRELYERNKKELHGGKS